MLTFIHVQIVTYCMICIAVYGTVVYTLLANMSRLCVPGVLVKYKIAMTLVDIGFFPVFISHPLFRILAFLFCVLDLLIANKTRVKEVQKVLYTSSTIRFLFLFIFHCFGYTEIIPVQRMMIIDILCLGVVLLGAFVAFDFYESKRDPLEV